MASMRAMVVKEAGGDFLLEEREIPEPGDREVLVKVHACGVCHSDMLAKQGAYPGVSFPVVPGHEIAGEIAALGANVEGWEAGVRPIIEVMPLEQANEAYQKMIDGDARFRMVLQVNR
jgi:alcohol dehydrogenase/propanol-preferring alcohol dehydrogenase